MLSQFKFFSDFLDATSVSPVYFRGKWKNSLYRIKELQSKLILRGEQIFEQDTKSVFPTKHGGESRWSQSASSGLYTGEEFAIGTYRPEANNWMSLVKFVKYTRLCETNRQQDKRAIGQNKLWPNVTEICLVPVPSYNTLLMTCGINESNAEKSG